MSKLQKALEMLRNKDRQTSPGSEHDSGHSYSTVRRHGNESGRGRQNGQDRNILLPEDTGAREEVPEISIRISPDMLRDQGLQPPHKDAELLSQQFGRIKRPILNNAFRTVISDSENANVIMVASALPNTGKSFCSFNLAMSIATERDVGAVLVDADVLKPNITRAFGLGGRVGLTDYLLDSSVSFDNILIGTDLHGIVIVPAGRQCEGATELLASRRMKMFMAGLSKRFNARAVIVDTPPLLLTNEANVLAELAGQIILVVEAGVSTHDSVTQALSSLNETKPINVILNKVRGGSFGEYVGSGYGYYSVPRRGLDNEQDSE